MIIEDFKRGDPVPVYRRVREEGRQLPDGLTYVDSWVRSDLKRCYQVVECRERSLVDAWIAQWDDLVDFEVIEVISSTEAAARVASRL